MLKLLPSKSGAKYIKSVPVKIVRDRFERSDAYDSTQKIYTSSVSGLYSFDPIKVWKNKKL